ncbi:hypothetical protein BDB01DRAFT_838952 [Pilobolus umbonatus]|nr:hypothetical protein BDB01DRAFT_838952 [Pilobolus umbonatus]
MRIAIITKNFPPKIDGVTRTPAKLLKHLQLTTHEVILFGPESGISSYGNARVYGTSGIPFLPYLGLKLDIWKPEFTQLLIKFNPDVIQLVDPVFMCATAAILFYIKELNIPIVGSYHTNLPSYCTQFGWGLFIFLMWAWSRDCQYFCSILPVSRERWLQRPHHMTPRCRCFYVFLLKRDPNTCYQNMDHALCHLVIVGDGSAMRTVQSIWHSQEDDLAAAYASTDIFTFPSFPETYGQIVLKVMASGLSLMGLVAKRNYYSMNNTMGVLRLPLGYIDGISNRGERSLQVVFSEKYLKTEISVQAPKRRNPKPAPVREEE